MILALLLIGCVLVEAQATDLKLQLQKTKKFSYIWCDTDSHAYMDGGFWRPLCPPSYYPVGDFGFDTTGQGCVSPSDREYSICVRAVQPEALARPKDYSPIWNDAGSGARDDVGIWRPVPPEGFVCLGAVGHGGNHDKPSVNEIWCVNQTLVVEGRIGQLIWNDVHSGAKADFAAWQVLPNLLSDDEYTGAFIGVNNYEFPKEKVYVIAKNAV